MDSKTIKSMMKKYGTKRLGRNGKVTGASVVCTVCGKIISFDGAEEIPDTEFVLTRLRTPMFVHASCYKDVWNSKIHWDREV